MGVEQQGEISDLEKEKGKANWGEKGEKKGECRKEARLLRCSW